MSNPIKHKKPGTVENISDGIVRTWGEMRFKMVMDGDKIRTDIYQDYTDTIQEWVARIVINEET